MPKGSKETPEIRVAVHLLKSIPSQTTWCPLTLSQKNQPHTYGCGWGKLQCLLVTRLMQNNTTNISNLLWPWIFFWILWHQKFGNFFSRNWNLPKLVKFILEKKIPKKFPIIFVKKIKTPFVTSLCHWIIFPLSQNIYFWFMKSRSTKAFKLQCPRAWKPE